MRYQNAVRWPGKQLSTGLDASPLELLASPPEFQRRLVGYPGDGTSLRHFDSARPRIWRTMECCEAARSGAQKRFALEIGPKPRQITAGSGRWLSYPDRYPESRVQQVSTFQQGLVATRVQSCCRRWRSRRQRYRGARIPQADLMWSSTLSTRAVLEAAVCNQNWGKPG